MGDSCCRFRPPTVESTPTELLTIPDDEFAEKIGNAPHHMLLCYLQRLTYNMTERDRASISKLRGGVLATTAYAEANVQCGNRHKARLGSSRKRKQKNIARAMAVHGCLNRGA